MKDPTSIPIAVQIPKMDGVDSIQIVKSGVVISAAKVNSLLLSGLVERIPLFAYKVPNCGKVKNLDEFRGKKRKLLLATVKVVQKEIDKGNYKKAKLLLEALIVEVKLFTSNSYIPSNEAELSQSTVVSEIRTIIKKLN